MFPASMSSEEGDGISGKSIVVTLTVPAELLIPRNTWRQSELTIYVISRPGASSFGIHPDGALELPPLRTGEVRQQGRTKAR